MRSTYSDQYRREIHLSSSVCGLKLHVVVGLFPKISKNSISFWKDVSGNKATSEREMAFLLSFSVNRSRPGPAFPVQANGIVASKKQCFSWSGQPKTQAGPKPDHLFSQAGDSL